MARAHSIWIVTSSNDGKIVRAFTVKHECATWLTKQADVSQFVISKYPDGSEPIVQYELSAEAFKKETIPQ